MRPEPARGRIAIGPSITGTVRATFYRPVAGQLGALASPAQPDDRARTVIVVDPAGGAHPPGQIVVADLDAAVTAALAAPEVESGLGVEIRLATSDRLAAPAPITGTPDAQHWRIVAPAGLTPVIIGALSFDAAGLTVEVTGCYLEGDVEAGASLAGLALNGVTMNPAAGRQLTVAPGAWTLRLAAGRSQLGLVRADLSAYPIELHDCVVDGAGVVLQPCGPPAPPVVPVPAVAAADRFPPQLVTTACTFAGPVAADTIEASDCLFLDGLTSVVTSGGYVRYSHLGPDDDPQAHPPAHQCLTGPRPAVMSDGAESAGYYAPILRTPGSRGASPLLTGASDGGEIGAYHHARRGPLALRLAQRLAEMVPLTIHPHLVVTRSEE